ncbi:MAG: prephenate dehydratase [Steroidobacteraceae bacterium]
MKKRATKGKSSKPVVQLVVGKQAKREAGLPPLSEIRARIDGIDDQLLYLLSERARIAQMVGVSKRQQENISTAELYRPERESQVLRRVLKSNAGPLHNEEVARLFREIMSACLAQQEPLKIGFLGPEGTFTQQAVYKHFGHSVRGVSLPSIPEVFHEVEAGHVDFGVVPIENSTGGVVEFSIDMFLNTPLKICGEIELRVHQNLMGKMRGMEGIKRICSHPQSLAQCRQWLVEHLPEVELLPVVSNSEAARRARDEEGTAAIAGHIAAEIYNLDIIVPEIEDRTDNTTRFIVLGKKSFAPSGHDKTTLMVASGDTQSPGTLYRLLAPLASNNISMTRIESRPSRRKKWDYVFFMDVEGHVDAEPLRSALLELKEHSSLFKVLGSYPAAVL